jgi:YesN/AraC family two-component response regulator
MTRILIADDHEVIRSGLRRVLEVHPGWEVVAEASDGKDAIRKGP